MALDTVLRIGKKKTGKDKRERRKRDFNNDDFKVYL